ncbi:MAG TPA: DNA polymerase III subunit delta' [Burkholderiaceae bacterium]|nr:DNA polymerase III subunit delta' [Burkholderiaceae bacterium]
MNPYPQLPWFDEDRKQLANVQARGVHAVLLFGARGMGKKSLALDLAADLLCEARVAGRACGACAGCALMRADNHPDLRVVVPQALAQWRARGAGDDDEVATSQAATATDSADPDKRESREIAIEQVRQLGPFLSVTAHRGGLKVVVLAPADALGIAAANAALKILEEPPPETFFILCTDAIDEVLPTIRSRCMLYRIGSAPTGLAAQWLSEQGLKDPEQCLAGSGGAPLEALSEANDERSQAVLTALAQWLVSGPTAQIGSIAGLAIPKVFHAAIAIRMFQRWGWDLLAHRQGAAIRYHPQQAERLQTIARRVSSDQALFQWHERLSALRRESLHPALNAKSLIEQALIGYVGLFVQH